jgi:hypothetical protein
MAKNISPGTAVRIRNASELNDKFGRVSHLVAGQIFVPKAENLLWVVAVSIFRPSPR